MSDPDPSPQPPPHLHRLEKPQTFLAAELDSLPTPLWEDRLSGDTTADRGTRVITIQLEIDSAGVPDPLTFRVISQAVGQTPELAIAKARALRFRPGRIQQCRVRALIHFPVSLP